MVVNTFRDTEVEKRPREAEISPHVKSLVQDNHFCVTRATDLYGLWLQTLDGITVTQVFQTLFETDGIYEP